MAEETKPDEQQSWAKLSDFSKAVVRDAVVNLLAHALTYITLGLIGLVVLLVVTGGKVPARVAVLIAVVAGG